MNTFQVIVTPEAEDDLREIYRYVASVLQEKRTAHKLVSKIKSAILDLVQMPERWPIYDKEPWKSRELRKVVVGNFIVFYLIQEKQVFVLSVLYGRRDVEETLE